MISSRSLIHFLSFRKDSTDHFISRISLCLQTNTELKEASGDLLTRSRTDTNKRELNNEEGTALSHY